MSTLLISHIMDVHANAVRWAILQNGGNCDVFFVADFPTRVTASFTPNSGLRLRGRELQGGAYECVWHRRFNSVAPHEELHEADRDMAAKIGRHFLRSMQSCAPLTRWVNPIAAVEQIEQKPYQLKLATDLSFKVPNTLISNEINDIREFLRNAAPCVVKSLRPLSWRLHDVSIVLNTTRVTAADLWDKVSVEACPMIYQEEIRKSVEYRIVVFGQDLVCIEIKANSEVGRLDWRDAPVGERNLRQVECPVEIADKIFAYMAEADIVHASFDFILSEDDQIYFLEVNQGGQFLWIERELPEVHLLDRMAQFLIANGDPGFVYRETPFVVTYSDYEQTGQAALDLSRNKYEHVNQTDTFVITESEFIGT